MNTKHVVSIEIDEVHLSGYSDEFLAACWHVAQANPQNGFTSRVPGELAERIGREIIRRWLRATPPELWHHQGHHHYWDHLRRFAKYEPGDGPAGSPEWKNGTWVLRQQDEESVEASGGAS